MTGNGLATPSIAAGKAVSTNGISHSPWPAILEKLPEYEPDQLLLSLEFYRESVLRRVVDDHGRVTLALLDIAEVARGLSAGVSLASGILPGDDAGPNTLFWARSSGSTRLGVWVGPRIWRLTLRSSDPGGKDRRLRLAFPGLVFICRPDAHAPMCSPPPNVPGTRRMYCTTARHRTCLPAAGSARVTTPSCVIP